MLRAILLLSVLFSLNPRSTVQDLQNEIQITLERSICFGRCPYYRVTIRGDGSVTYEGWKFVKVEGTHGKKIPAAKVQELVRAFTDIDFFNLKDVYDSEINADGSTMTPTDMPMICFASIAPACVCVWLIEVSPSPQFFKCSRLRPPLHACLKPGTVVPIAVAGLLIQIDVAHFMLDR
jgi:hypothetical protein